MEWIERDRREWKQRAVAGRSPKRTSERKPGRAAWLVISMVMTSQSGFAQMAASIESRLQALTQSGTLMVEANAPDNMRRLFREPLRGGNILSITGARWLQAQFADFNLGTDSRLKVTVGSESQTFTQEALEAARGLSAVFDGGEMSIEVVPHRDDVSVRLVSMTAGLPLHRDVGDEFSRQPQAVPLSTCGTDGRLKMADARVGRIWPYPCTAFLIANDRLVTARHCLFEPTTSGAPTSAMSVQFNIPESGSDGTPKPPGVVDQYTIDRDSIKSGGGGHGDDWAVFRVFPNSETGKLPHQVQGDVLTPSNTAQPSEVRVIGFGFDGPEPDFGANGAEKNSDNRISQSALGYVVGEVNDVEIRYLLDTNVGNSGSPIIDASDSSVVVGIHNYAPDNGTCDHDEVENTGTSFRNEALWAAVGGAG